jgi:hypothetical protein
VAYGAVTTGSAATGTAQRIKQPIGSGVCNAVVTSTPAKNSAVGGGRTEGVAALKSGPRILSGGVGYHDGYGESICGIAISNTDVRVTPVLLIYATATAEGTAQLAAAALGTAICTAVGSNGDVNTKPSSKAEAAGLSIAVVGTAVAQVFAAGKAMASNGRAINTAATVAVSSGGGVTVGAAGSNAWASRICIGGGESIVEGAVQGVPARRANSSGACNVVAIGAAEMFLNPLSAGGTLIEFDVPDTFVEFELSDYSIEVDAYDNFVEAA